MCFWCCRPFEVGLHRAYLPTLRKGHYSPDNDDLETQKGDAVGDRIRSRKRGLVDAGVFKQVQRDCFGEFQRNCSLKSTAMKYCWNNTHTEESLFLFHL